jgi:hypothetical protein
MGILMVLGGLFLGGAGLLSSTDPAGMFLMLIAAVLLLVIGGLSLWVRPKLAVEGRQIHIRTLFRGTCSYSFDDVRRAQLITYPRFGRRVPHLEFDLDDERGHDGERLVIYGRWDLGTSPLDVADALRAAGLAVEERS